MNDEQKQELGQELGNPAVVAGFSRSEKPATTATPPAGAGVSPPWGPRGGSPEASDEPIWAEVEPSRECAAEGVAAADTAADASEPESLPWDDTPPAPVRKTRRRGTLKPGAERPVLPLSPQQKLLLLDTWQRSGLPARDFGALVNVSRQTLYAWKRRFEELGPAGLVDQPKGAKLGSKLPELTKRTILMLKLAHPDWGCERISDMLVRGPALPASPNAVARVLREAGYVLQEQPTKPHPDRVRRFERATPNQLWQTDLFTFMLKRQNRRVYLVAFMDDHSRFITGFGLHGSQSTPLVIEVVRAAIAGHGVPQEILTDNGSQYVTWRGKSQFTRELEKLGIKQIVAKPQRPQTLGKIERFWGTLWRECIESAIFLDLEDARRRIGLFIDHYNFQRVHSGIDGLVPADRFFQAAPQVLATLRQRVAANALELARHGVPKKPFYLTGQVEGQPFSVHQEGDRVILRQAGQEREEIELVPPLAEGAADLPPAICPQGVPTSYGSLPEELPPGVSPLDDYLASPDSEGELE
jgi:transposase InsO family protein